MNLFFFLRAFLRGKLMSTKKFQELIDSIPDKVSQYRQTEQSDELKEYEQLKMSVTSDFFKSNKEKILKQKNGKALWAQSPEAKQEARFKELDANVNIQSFLKTNAKDIERAESLEPFFVDNMTWTDFAASEWKAGVKYPTEDFKNQHSYVDELQANNGGKNVTIENGIMHINTRKETVTAPAWDSKKGMVMHPFAYTSDIIYYDRPMSRDNGLVMIKAQCRGYVNHGAYLRSDKHIPMLHVFDYTGFRLYTGLTTRNGQKMHRLQGLQPVIYMVYSVAWNKTEIMWFVNNMLVHKEPNTLPAGEKLYLHLYSNLFPGQRHVTEGSLDVAWVRCFTTKQ